MRTAFLARTPSGASETKRRKGWHESDFESKRSFDEKSDEAFGAELGIFLKFLKVGELVMLRLVWDKTRLAIVRRIKSLSQYNSKGF